ncbi:MAG: stimulus-sensing domain-containing protein [Rhodospirillales bacterium]
MAKGGQSGEPRTAVRSSAAKPLVSPLTRRILTVNLLALGTLVAGLLYLGEYRRTLIDNELTSLKVQAEMFAAALGEGAVVSETPNGQFLVSDVAYQITRRLVEITETRARLFRADGTMIVDSRRLGGAGGTVQIEILRPPEADFDLLDFMLNKYDDLARALSGEDPLPKYRENALQTAGDFAETRAALIGDSAVAARRFGHDDLMLSAAVPVQRYKQVLGAIMLSRDGQHVRSALHDVRLDILKVVAVALSITIALSLYLAGTIARPIRRLAIAAERIRHDRGRKETIPLLTERRDEIGDLAISLKEMTEALWLRMDAIERFAADVAHEIKNPLTSLRSAVETAGRIEDPARRAKLMAIILDDVARLDRLISDISNASRLDAELSRTEFATVDLAGVLGAIVDMHKAAGREADAAIHLEIVSNGGLEVEGIEDRLVQVFRNLIANANTFSPPGGRIRIALGREGGWLVVTIDDDGPGIPDGKETAIFDRFYTARPEGEKFGTHSGLGLSISKQIIDVHEGEIWAMNRRDGDGGVLGARFVVRLPADSG